MVSIKALMSYYCMEATLSFPRRIYGVFTAELISHVNLFIIEVFINWIASFDAGFEIVPSQLSSGGVFLTLKEVDICI